MFYIAGKVWHAPMFQEMRDTFGFPINSRWIDLDGDSDLVRNRKDELWQICLEDVRDAEYLVLYADNEQEEQRGALVEVGMAMGFGIPIYAIGKCKSTKATEISDVAFTHHKSWNWVKAVDIVEGLSIIHLIEKERKNAVSVA